MLRKNLWSLLFCVFLFQSFLPGRTAFSDAPPPLLIVKPPYLQSPKKDAITIMWETNKKASSVVEYWVKKKKQAEKFASPELVYIHEVTLSGLEVETVYNYQVTSVEPAESGTREEKATSDERVFKTAVREKTPFCFAVYGDNRGDDPHDPFAASIHKRIADAMAEKRPDLFINTGDVVQSGQNYWEWEKMFFGPLSELLKTTPFYISLGNHERRSDSRRFNDYVSYPEPEVYYSFDYGNAHFVVLDSYPRGKFRKEFPGKMPFVPGTTQYEWLVKDLQSENATRALWRFAVIHYPPYCAADYGRSDVQVLSPVFEEYNVDVVFSGHSHIYERTHPLKAGEVDLDDGVTYVVTGGGGAPLSKLHAKRAYWTAEAASKYHYCLIKIAQGNLHMMVYDIDGKLIDLLFLEKPAS
jgi:hypothetical protein